MSTVPLDMPEDHLVALFPGADHPGLLVDALITVKGAWEPPRPKGLLIPGSMIIARARENTCWEEPLSFLLGMALPEHRHDDTSPLLVQWWLPPLAPIVSLRGGRKKNVLDHFGEWKSIDMFKAADLSRVSLPSVDVFYHLKH